MVCEIPNDIFCAGPDKTCVQMCAPVGTYYSYSEDKFAPVAYRSQQIGSWWLPKVVKNTKEKASARVLYATLPQHCQPDQFFDEEVEILPNGDLILG